MAHTEMSLCALQFGLKIHLQLKTQTPDFFFFSYETLISHLLIKLYMGRSHDEKTDEESFASPSARVQGPWSIE